MKFKLSLWPLIAIALCCFATVANGQGAIYRNWATTNTNPKVTASFMDPVSWATKANTNAPTLFNAALMGNTTSKGPLYFYNIGDGTTVSGSISGQAIPGKTGFIFDYDGHPYFRMDTNGMTGQGLPFIGSFSGTGSGLSDVPLTGLQAGGAVAGNFLGFDGANWGPVVGGGTTNSGGQVYGSNVIGSVSSALSANSASSLPPGATIGFLTVSTQNGTDTRLIGNSAGITFVDSDPVPYIFISGVPVTNSGGFAGPLFGNAATANSATTAGTATSATTATRATSAQFSTNYMGQIYPSNYNNGSSASGSTFARGDGQWAVPPGLGDFAKAGNNVTTGSNYSSGMWFFGSSTNYAQELSVSALRVDGGQTNTLAQTNLTSIGAPDVYGTTFHGNATTAGTANSALATGAGATINPTSGAGLTNLGVRFKSSASVTVTTNNPGAATEFFNFTANTATSATTATSANNSTNFWGQLSKTNFNNGTAADNTTWLRGDGTWVTPPGSGDVTQAGQNNFTGSNFLGGSTMLSGTIYGGGNSNLFAGNVGILGGLSVFGGGSTIYGPAFFGTNGFTAGTNGVFSGNGSGLSNVTSATATTATYVTGNGGAPLTNVVNTSGGLRAGADIISTNKITTMWASGGGGFYGNGDNVTNLSKLYVTGSGGSTVTSNYAGGVVSFAVSSTAPSSNLTDSGYSVLARSNVLAAGVTSTNGFTSPAGSSNYFGGTTTFAGTGSNYLGPTVFSNTAAAITFITPTNTPTDAYVLTATGTAGDTAWKAATGSGTGIQTNGGTGINNLFTNASIAGGVIYGDVSRANAVYINTLGLISSNSLGSTTNLGPDVKAGGSVVAHDFYTRFATDGQGYYGRAIGLTNDNGASLADTLTSQYVTNTVTTGNATITMDMAKSFALLSTNVACTLSLANVPTSTDRTATLILSNSAASGTILITLSGFSALVTNYPSSTFYVTNLSAKRQVTHLTVNCYAGFLTNAIVTHFYEP